MRKDIKQTAMQQFIEYLEKNYYINELTNFDKDKIKFLEKEKDQICNAYTEGLEGQYIASEYYYNVTYNK